MSNALKATPAPTMGEYWERSAWVKFKIVDFHPPRSTPTRHLSGTERATIRVQAPRLEDLPDGNSLLDEARFRMAIMQHRGFLKAMSGQELASMFQRLVWPEHPAKHALRGWEILRKMDELGYVEVWTSADPLNNDSTQRRTMRLHDRCAELSRKGNTP
jgi:hypothetical protein